MKEGIKKAQQVRVFASWVAWSGVLVCTWLLFYGSALFAIVLGFAVHSGYKLLQKYAHSLERQSYREVLQERLKQHVEHLVEDLQRMEHYLQVQQELRYFNPMGVYDGNTIFKYIGLQDAWYEFKGVQEGGSGLSEDEKKLQVGAFLYERTAMPQEKLIEYDAVS